MVITVADRRRRFGGAGAAITVATMAVAHGRGPHKGPGIDVVGRLETGEDLLDRTG